MSEDRKAITITVEWDGCCPEWRWAQVIKDDIERGDASRVTTVTKVEYLTGPNAGKTFRY